jgi:hypothetical protein
MNHDKHLRSPLNLKGAIASPEQTVSQPNSPAIIRKSSGPQTAAGKQRSKYNARKHGIFSRETVLKGESRQQYESVLAGLLDDFQTVGSAEELLVEKLATLSWRYRRLLIAESAEIQRRAEFIEWEKGSEVQQEVEQIEEERRLASSSRQDTGAGLIARIQNPAILTVCIDSLIELRNGINVFGFNKESNLEILRKIYGGIQRSRVRESLLDLYGGLYYISQLPEEERKRKGCLSPSQCVEYVVKAINGEMLRLKEFQKSQASIEASQNKLNRLRLQVPDSPALERLLRYEASLDRSFDRTLSQLERLQRMRRGQPVPPTLKIEVND